MKGERLRFVFEPLLLEFTRNRSFPQEYQFQTKETIYKCWDLKKLISIYTFLSAHLFHFCKTRSSQSDNICTLILSFATYLLFNCSNTIIVCFTCNPIFSLQIVAVLKQIWCPYQSNEYRQYKLEDFFIHFWLTFGLSSSNYSWFIII